MTTGARSLEAEWADAPEGFVVTAAIRLDLLYLIRVYFYLISQDRDLVICIRLAAFGPKLGLQPCWLAA